MLRSELRSWRNEGLIDEAQAAVLTGRYDLDRLGREAHGLLMNTIFLVGAALIACGVVAFVAAHWGAIPKWYKVGMLLAAMLAAHAGGYYLWQVRGTREYLGHALTVLGTLIFGANVGLFAQIFHVSERMYNGFMAWALGALLVALVLRSVPNAIVALAASVAWFWWYVVQNETAFLLYPVLVAAVFLPTCYWWRSRVLFALSVVAVTMALIANTMVAAQDGLIGFAGLVVPIMVLWCYGAIHARDGKWWSFGVIARSLGALGLAGVAYVLSFHQMAVDLAEALKRHSEAGLTWSGWLGAKDWLSFGTVVLLALAAALAAGFRDRRGMPRLLVPVLAAAAIIVAPQLPEPKVWSTVLFNVTAVGLAAYGIGVGATTYERRPYWAGLGLVILLIASRFFEYETNLMIKAAGFLGAGFLLIYAGLKFEGRMRTDRGRVEGHF